MMSETIMKIRPHQQILSLATALNDVNFDDQKAKFMHCAVKTEPENQRSSSVSWELKSLIKEK